MKVFYNNEFVDANITANNGLISNIEFVKGDDDYLIPGLIDIHTHGNSSYDFSDAGLEGVAKMARWYAENGVTSFAGTTMTAPIEDIKKAIKVAVEYNKAPNPKCAKYSAMNIEGPYFSKAKKGAQNPAYLKDPDVKEFREMYELSEGLIRIIDVAPELDGAIEFIKEVKGYCRVSEAHSDASYEEAKEGFEAGATHVTHLFNGLPSIHHRKPGVIGAASECDNVYAELICDGLHVHESAVRMAYKLFPNKICLISDSLRCAGMPEGEYFAAGQKTYLKDGVARLEDGTIAGSCIPLMTGLKNALKFGININEAVLSATLNPAKQIGIDKITGSIEVGKKADYIICDKNFDIKDVFVDGKSIF